MSHRTVFIAAVAACLATSAAHAEERPSIRVNIGDLNLASQRDVNRLYRRVAEAAGEICGRGPLANFIAGPPPEFVACRDRVVEATLSRLGAPLVVALREKIKVRSEQEAR